MLIIYSVIALFGSFIWLYYFRMIDVFQPDKWQILLPSFLIGGVSPFLVLEINTITDTWTIPGGEVYLNIAFDAFFKAGLVEEFAKVMAFGLSFLIIGKQIRESIDYIIHICLCALGFSTTENVIYFMNHGAEIIDARFIMSSFGHIFNSSVFAYGVIYALYKSPKYKAAIIILFFILAVTCHGFYDFLLMYDFPGNILLFILYFLTTVSFFSLTLNNALNHSENFSYQKVVFPDTVFLRLLICYFILLALKGGVIVYQKNLLQALKSVYSVMLVTLPLMIIIFQRITRFTLIKGHWFNFRLEFPVTTIPYYSETGVRSKFVVRGDGQQEAILGSMFGSHNFLCAISDRTAWFDSSPEVVMNKKFFLENYSIFYELHFPDSKPDNNIYFIKAKISGSTLVNKQFPIVALLQQKRKLTLSNFEPEGFDDFEFLGWCYLKPVTTTLSS